ncbi:ATP-binding protein [Candidatus Woesearchaeota archaeon]|nr:ATP-binding protein [Candidatus Woesearchaeota archaeon]
MINEQTLINILDKWNNWNEKINTGLPRRQYINEILKFMNRKEIIVLKGIRRSGKSTIMKQLMTVLNKKGFSKKQILYLNLEDYNLSRFLSIELLELVLQVYLKRMNPSKRIFFFIDEIQLVEDWEKWIRTKYDLQENIKFIISGSSASLISKEFSTKLTGRNISFQIKPLSFTELLDFKEGSKADLLNEYLEYGGFPEVVLEKEPNVKLKLLHQYFDDIIHKDVIDRYNVRNPKQVHLLAKYLCANTGQKISYHKLAKSFGLSNETTITYVKYLLDTFLFYEVNYFSYSARIKHDVTKLSKIYSADNGLINLADIKFSKENGKKYENAVCIKLIEKHNGISYWSEKNEVDFIVNDNAINVVSSEKIPEREFQGLEEIKKKFRQIKKFTIITKNTKETKGDIILTPILDFLINT